MIPFGVTSLTRFEHIADISYTANTPANLPTQGGQLVDTRWCWGLLLSLEGRATMPGSGMPTAQEADGIAQLIERVTMEGFHRVRQRNERFFDLRGADVDFLTKRWTLASLPSAPTTWSYTASATNDFRQHLLVPFVPMGISAKEQQAYLLDVPNYDTLKLTVQWGDALSIFAAGTSPTLSAYGSTTGSPKVRVGAFWALAGASRFVNRVPGRTFRYFQELTGSLLTTTATGVRMIDIPRGNIIRAITVKTGVKSTTISSGNNAYVSLSDSIFSNIKINRGINRPVRYYPLMHQIQCENVLQSLYAKSGYAVIDFARNGSLAESFDARPLVSGPSGQIDFFAETDVTGTTDQAATFIWEELQALPIATTVR